MEVDIHSQSTFTASLASSALVDDANTFRVDTQGFESFEWLVTISGFFVGGGYDITCEESDSTAFTGEQTPVPPEQILGKFSDTVAIQVSEGDASKVYRVGLIAKKRYQRCVLTETGTITGGRISVHAFLSNSEVLPTSDQNT